MPVRRSISWGEGKVLDVTITIIVDDQAPKGLVAEHGFAAWIRADEHSILFDTGQGAALVTNARALDIPLHETADLVLSHGHDDHTGGLA